MHGKAERNAGAKFRPILLVTSSRESKVVLRNGLELLKSKFDHLKITPSLISRELTLIICSSFQFIMISLIFPTAREYLSYKYLGILNKIRIIIIYV